MSTIINQLLCVAVAVALAYLFTPRVGEWLPVTFDKFAYGPLAGPWTPVDRLETGASWDWYRYGDTDAWTYRQGLHLMAAGTLAAIAPTLPLGHTPAGLAGLLVLAVLYGHMFAIDLATHRLPNGLTLLSGLVALVTVLAAGLGHPAQMQSALLGGAAVLSIYGLLWVINKNGLGKGDVQLSFSIGIVLGWNGWEILAYGWAAAWVLQGAVSGWLMLMAHVKSRKAMLPLGPAIIGSAFVVPMLLHP